MTKRIELAIMQKKGEKNMKIRNVLILLSVIVLVLTGCKKKPGESEASVPVNTEEKDTIVLTDPDTEEATQEEVLPDTGNFIAPDETAAKEAQKKAAEKKESQTEAPKTSAPLQEKPASGSKSFGKSNPDSDWSRYVSDANPKTGVSWDGKSKIIYTYENGTTGTEPVVGATYEVAPGMVTVLCKEELPGYQPEPYDPNCNHCGKKMGDGRNGTCVRWLSGDINCPNCGEFVPGNTCHTCK